MIIDCAHYLDGRRREEGPVGLQEAAAQRAEGGFVWLGLFEPGEAELAEVRDTFGLHELAIEDALNFHVRPKIENYDHDVELVRVQPSRGSRNLSRACRNPSQASRNRFLSLPGDPAPTARPRRRWRQCRCRRRWAGPPPRARW